MEERICSKDWKREGTKMFNLNNVHWRPFRVGELFHIENCKCSKVGALEPGDFPYVGATANNNGVLHFVEYRESLVTKGNCIAFICDGEGSIGLSVYKAEDFIGSTTVRVGRCDSLNKYTALFITTVADTVRSKYNFGYKRNARNLKREIIHLPANEDGNPDWSFMEAYMRRLEKQILQRGLEGVSQKKSFNNSFETLPPASSWKVFDFVNIFNIKNGFYNKKPPCTDSGSIPFIGATDSNNGFTGFTTEFEITQYSKTGSGKNQSLEKKLFDGNAICVTNNGSVGYAYYQVSRFTCSHDVNPLYLRKKELNRYIALFLICCIEKQRVCFTYVRKWRPKRMIKSKLLLPVDDNGEPHWRLMESVVKAKETQLIEEYLKFAKQRTS